MMIFDPYLVNVTLVAAVATFTLPTVNDSAGSWIVTGWPATNASASAKTVAIVVMVSAEIAIGDLSLGESTSFDKCIVH